MTARNAGRTWSVSGTAKTSSAPSVTHGRRKMIRSVGGGKFVVLSEKGKRLSRPLGFAAAKRRLAQIEYFDRKG
jgi:hypothetical protein